MAREKKYEKHKCINSAKKLRNTKLSSKSKKVYFIQEDSWMEKDELNFEKIIMEESANALKRSCIKGERFQEKSKGWR